MFASSGVEQHVLGCRKPRVGVVGLLWVFCAMRAGGSQPRLAAGASLVTVYLPASPRSEKW